MNIANVTSTRSTIDFLDPAQASRPTGKQTLDVNDFLKLLTVQLQSQDPMKPMEDTQFISQMASFTSLQQMKQLSTDFKNFSSEQRISSAQSFLGKVVTVTTADGDVIGQVKSVKLLDGSPRIVIGTGSYDPAKVTNITAPAVPASTIH